MSPAAHTVERVVVALGAFKGSLSATDACSHAADGVRAALREATEPTRVTEIPAADGGDDSLEALFATGSRRVDIRVDGPTGTPVDSAFAIFDTESAFVELAATCGLQLLGAGEAASAEPNTATALGSTTRGLGQAIAAALDAGARRIVIGLGGSASTDGGTGMLAALGARFLDSAGHELPPGGGSLTDLETVDTSGLDERIADTEFVLACDVDAPLLGPDGAAAVFAPQKGATPDDVELLERGLARLAELSDSTDHSAAGLAEEPGAGAAGGTGFAALACLDARVRPGFDVISELTGLRDAIPDADLVLTGEGTLDSQSLSGKTPVAVARLAAEHEVPCLAVCGISELTDDETREAGFADVGEVRDEDDAGPLVERVARRLVAAYLES